jgi:hypothetical protein
MTSNGSKSYKWCENNHMLKRLLVNACFVTLWIVVSPATHAVYLLPDCRLVSLYAPFHVVVFGPYRVALLREILFDLSLFVLCLGVWHLVIRGIGDISIAAAIFVALLAIGIFPFAHRLYVASFSTGPQTSNIIRGRTLSSLDEIAKRLNPPDE